MRIPSRNGACSTRLNGSTLLVDWVASPLWGEGQGEGNQVRSGVVDIPQTDAIPDGVLAGQFLPPFDFGQAYGSRPICIGCGWR